MWSTRMQDDWAVPPHDPVPLGAIAVAPGGEVFVGGVALSRLDPKTGRILWSSPVFGEDLAADAVVVLQDGTIAIEGWFAGNVTFGAFKLTNPAQGYTGFLALFDPDGKALRAERLSSLVPAMLEPTDTTTDEQGHLVIAGFTPDSTMTATLDVGLRLVSTSVISGNARIAIAPKGRVYAQREGQALSVFDSSGATLWTWRPDALGIPGPLGALLADGPDGAFFVCGGRLFWIDAAGTAHHDLTAELALAPAISRAVGVEGLVITSPPRTVFARDDGTLFVFGAAGQQPTPGGREYTFAAKLHR
jgi:outer membrane protein assembly factor BamB